MTLYQFTALSYTDQLAVVNADGTHLATRWQGTTLILLYQVPEEVFVEVYYDANVKRLTAVQAFPTSASLDAYAPGIRFVEGLDGLADW